MIDDAVIILLDIEYGELATVITWCDDNIQGNWYVVEQIGAGSQPGTYQFTFTDELAATMFYFRWA